MVAEPPVSSSSLPPSGSSFPDVSFETTQSTRSAEFSQPILPFVLPRATRSPSEEPVEFNWPPSGAWSSFGEEGDFPPLMSGSPFFAVVVPLSPHSLFEALTAESDMDSSSPVGSEGMLISRGEYRPFPEYVPHVSTQSSPPSVSLPLGYRSLS